MPALGWLQNLGMAGSPMAAAIVYTDVGTFLAVWSTEGDATAEKPLDAPEWFRAAIALLQLSQGGGTATAQVAPRSSGDLQSAKAGGPSPTTLPFPVEGRERYGKFEPRKQWGRPRPESELGAEIAERQPFRPEGD